MMRHLYLALLALPLATMAEDWPQWLGPDGKSEWREAGIVSRFPESGPPVLWRVPVGLGYGGPAVADGRVYIMDYRLESGTVRNSPSGRSRLTGSERVLCLDAEDGSILWTHAYERPYYRAYPGGPRTTPTVADGRVYTLGAEGDFLCLDAGTGTVLWRKNYRRDYRLDTPVWGFSSHPVVVDGTIYCIVGGSGSAVIAYDAATGTEKWRALSSSEPGYGTPAIIDRNDERQLVVWLPDAISGLSLQDGKVLWSLPLKPGYNMAVMTPRQHGNHIFASAIGNVGALIRLGDSDAAFEWKGTNRTGVYCVNSTPFIKEGVIYGCNVESSELMAVRMKDGQRLWATLGPTIGEGKRGRHGTAFIVRHQDRFFLMSETGDLILARLEPEGYEEISRFRVLEPTNEAFGRACVWSHPAFAMKSCFARNDKELVRVDLAR